MKSIRTKGDRVIKAQVSMPVVRAGGAAVARRQNPATAGRAHHTGRRNQANNLSIFI
jgi:hypothetical protein